ncbi:hypothetical protein K435DRAFT_802630 [Dendrothele bispora CBS 962.96]|uniref:Myb-like domain-containing protein n=1 Tax=Dendrothele bispora (strain CBS 962.96) TaxID=1314807 RepID=A0A4S8LKK3_DENBC|nr:hypothetical protein K435DRAFT_802630 [Dendrothele bispora CBS 962.96]
MQQSLVWSGAVIATEAAVQSSGSGEYRLNSNPACQSDSESTEKKDTRHATNPQAAHQSSPGWECEEGDLPEEDPVQLEGTQEVAEEPGDEGEDLPDNEEHDTLSSDTHPTDTVQSRNARAPKWRPWQDRYLVKMVDQLRPFEANRHEANEAWDNLAFELLEESTEKDENNPVDRTGTACRSRFFLLVKFHEAEQTRSKQKTGTDEEVSEHIRLLDDLVEQVHANKIEGRNTSAQAQKKADMEKQAGLEIRDAAMRGIAQRENLTDIADENAPLRERQGQRKRRRSSSEASEKGNIKKGRYSKLEEVLTQHNRDDEERLKEAHERDEMHHQEILEVQNRTIDVLKDLNESIKDMHRESQELRHRDRETQHQQSQLLASLATLVVANSSAKQ